MTSSEGLSNIWNRRNGDSKMPPIRAPTWIGTRSQRNGVRRSGRSFDCSTGMTTCKQIRTCKRVASKIYLSLIESIQASTLIFNGGLTTLSAPVETVSNFQGRKRRAAGFSRSSDVPSQSRWENFSTTEVNGLSHLSLSLTLRLESKLFHWFWKIDSSSIDLSMRECRNKMVSCAQRNGEKTYVHSGKPTTSW